MSLLVLGATSRIAGAVAERFAARGQDLVLAGRNPEELERLAEHYRARHGVEVDVVPFDASDLDSHPGVWSRLRGRHDDLENVLLAFGSLGDHEQDVRDPAGMQRTLVANFNGAASILTVIAADLEERGRGCIAVIGSVAGDRGRASNYVYGAAKGGLDLFCSGLRNRLSSAGVHVLTVKPGFVDTPMTAGMPLPGPLVASAERVARDIERAMQRRKNVLYTPWFWRFIMLLIRLIPEFRFKKMKL